MKNIFKLLILFVSATLFVTVSNAGCGCKARQNATPSPLMSSLAIPAGCPCLSGSYLQQGSKSSYGVNACVSRFDFSQLTGSAITLTSQDYGEAFSCFYQNFNTGEKEEIVEYASRQQILDYHQACDRVIKQLANYYNQNCISN